MKNIVFSLCFVITVSCAQDRKRTVSSLENARTKLSLALKDKMVHNVVGKSAIIKDSVTAVAAAEAILFGIYNKEIITSQKPYEIFHINNYWVINGTLPDDTHGGTFLIITDDRNGRVLQITHGK